MGRLSFAVVLVGLLGNVARSDGPTSEAALAKTASAGFAALKTETLPNGLKVFVLPVPGSPVVTTMVVYKVGSADELPDQTGLSHYLEHLMFKGTDKLQPGDIDRLTQRNGGANNAYTTEDLTAYHFNLAADRWTIALDIEADRMRNLRVDEKHEFQQEKGAVIAELKGNEDSPWTLEQEAILPLLFAKGTPYHHPIIGEEKHVRAATAQIITSHYNKWYQPNNAALIIVGGVDAEAALKEVRARFAAIPKQDLPARKPIPAAPNRTAQVRKEFPSKFDVPRMIAGFNTVKFGDPEDYVFDLLQLALSNGKNSRLYHRLVEEERLASTVHAESSPGRYPGWFGVYLEMLPGKDRAKAERIVFEELERLAKEPLSPAEFRRLRRTLLAEAIFTRESVSSLADTIARSVGHDQPDYFQTYLDKVLAVTPADIQRVVGEYLKKTQAAVVWSIPEEDGKGGGGPGKDPKRSLKKAEGKAVGDLGILTRAKRTVLPNGLTLVTLEDHRLPIVVAAARVAEVRLREPAEQTGIASLVGLMLEEGTATRTGDDIAKLLDETGGHLEFSGSGGTIKILTPDAQKGIDLLLDALQHPSFPEEALDRQRDQLITTISEVETQPQNRAQQTFQSLVYGKHPFGRSEAGKRAIVEGLTRANLKEFHTQTFVPNRTTLVVVGDIDTAAVTQWVEKATAGWKKDESPLPKIAEPPGRKEPMTKIISDPTASQTHMYLGHLGVKRSDPDYYPLVVLDYVLGTGHGFTDRLSSNLRDRQGLAYTVNAQITGSATDQPGMFLGYVGTFPDKFSAVRDGFLAEVKRIREEPPTAQEVADVKEFLQGSLAFRLTSYEAMANQLLSAERYKLGYGLIDDFRTAIAKVTPEDVHRVARKHLDPDKLVIVAVGPIGPDGKPLPPPKK